MSDANTVTKYLNTLGLSEYEVAIYTSLLHKGEMTILQLSRDAGIERTRLYRLVDSMVEKGLIVERLDYNKRYLQVCEPSVLERLANEALTKSAFLASNLPSFLGSIRDMRDSSMPTNVKFYRGVEGVRQVLWNELKAEGDLCVYSYRMLQEIVGEKFFIKWSQEAQLRGLIVKDLRSIEFLQSAIAVPPLPFDGDIIRYIDPEILDISIEMDIYNDVVTIFNWHQGDVYAVEIRDVKLAKMQRQIFNILWERAEEYTHEEWMEKVKAS